MTSLNVSDLKASAQAIRKTFLNMHYKAQSGHIGTGLSSIEILTYLYGVGLRDQTKALNQKFILSKGHGASALYATLHHYKLFTDELLSTYYQDGTLLPAHPAPKAHEAIPVATGSLGHGLPIATGMAYARHYLGAPFEGVVCLVSDGECNEGTVWEAALFAGHHRLHHLTVFVDANGLQGFGRNEDILQLEPFADKWKAFGFDVLTIDGHSFEEIDSAFRTPVEKPKCIIARTSKGKGVSFMENRMEWHYLPMKEDQFRQAIKELERT